MGTLIGLFQLFLLCGNAGFYAVTKIGSVPVSIIIQRCCERKGDILRGKTALKLRPIECLRRMDLTGEGGIQRLRPQLAEQPPGRDFHGIIPDVGQKPCTKIKERAVIKELDRKSVV